ncbi:MAG: peptidoglycan DD-metalloendopeptidase family protein [Deltaproteobacteria bacterium]|nr:peptidoglycan DD-metalloendopeptidase family protein [Deltaproteobacteria bacterium]
MQKSYSILILPTRGTKMRRMVFSRRFLQSLLIAGVLMFGISGWMVDNYRWLRIQSGNDQKLRVEAVEEVVLLRTELQEQRHKLSSLQDRIDSSQKLLANWKGLREKIASSLPRKRRAAFSNGKLVESLESSLTSIEGELEGLIAAIPTIWPTKGWVSSGFGRRKDPVTGEPEYHNGIDIANHKGTPIYAPGDAVVKFVGYGKANGRSIILDHGQGITTQYSHLSKANVKKGQRVRRREKIGAVGSTGRSTNPHLHYEVRVNRIPINPRRYLLKSRPEL